MITNYEKAVSIYETGGQYAVYDAAKKGHLHTDLWQQCLPCEDETPHEANICLVCGTQITKMNGDFK